MSISVKLIWIYRQYTAQLYRQSKAQVYRQYTAQIYTQSKAQVYRQYTAQIYRQSTTQIPAKVYMPSALGLLHQSYQHYQ